MFPFVEPKTVTIKYAPCLVADPAKPVSVRAYSARTAAVSVDAVPSTLASTIGCPGSYCDDAHVVLSLAGEVRATLWPASNTTAQTASAVAPPTSSFLGVNLSTLLFIRDPFLHRFRGGL